jgi:hypothetical protein
MNILCRVGHFNPVLFYVSERLTCQKELNDNEDENENEDTAEEPHHSSHNYSLRKRKV